MGQWKRKSRDRDNKKKSVEERMRGKMGKITEIRRGVNGGEKGRWLEWEKDGEETRRHGGRKKKGVREWGDGEVAEKK